MNYNNQSKSRLITKLTASGHSNDKSVRQSRDTATCASGTCASEPHGSEAHVPEAHCPRYENVSNDSVKLFLESLFVLVTG